MLNKIHSIFTLILSKIHPYFTTIASSSWFWVLNIIAGLFLLVVAVYYQHFHNEMPCVLCVQVRLWISLLIVISMIVVFIHKYRIPNSIAHFFVFAIAIALTERSYQLLGTERGFIFSDCGFTSGLPTWFAIEEWLPWLYRIETSCGYTPEIMFGITMAEALMFLSVSLLMFSAVVTLASFKIHND